MTPKSIKGEYNEPPWNNLAEFTNPNGKFESNVDGRLTFVPKLLPPTFKYDHEIIALLAEAERKVGELKGRTSGLENLHILIRAHLKKDAVISSKIEGTLASLEDLNVHEVIGDIGKKDGENTRLKEVVNYVIALEASLKQIRHSDQRVSLDMLKNAHNTLMTGVRGGDKKPGEIRVQQNWIINTHRITQEIIYTPPSPENISVLLKNLEDFFHSDNKGMSMLIQCAVMHYQFEAIHPFLDGNGRIGRLLLPLILCEKEIMPEPLLYLSSYFDEHLEQYYGGLLSVSQKSTWSDWIKFFLRAFIEQADETTRSIQKMSILLKKYKEILLKKNVSGNAVLLMERLFSNPYVTIPKAAQFLDVTYPSAKNAVMALVEANILEQTNIRYKSKIFVAVEVEKTINVD